MSVQFSLTTELHDNVVTPVALQRLKKRDHFLLMRHKASVVFMPSFVLQIAPSSLFPKIPIENNACVVGFTVTKKVGNAVIRNRVKRRLKEAVRLVFPEHAKGDYAYVVIGNVRALTLPFSDLVQQLQAALHKTPLAQHQTKRHKKKG